MISGEEKLLAVRRYLEKAFPGHTVSDSGVTGDRKPGYRIEKDNLRYEIDIHPDFLARHATAEIEPLLAKWNLREELIRAEGMPMVLTDAGIRLTSSN